MTDGAEKFTLDTEKQATPLGSSPDGLEPKPHLPNPGPVTDSPSPALGPMGFEQSVRLLEFDQVRQQLAEFTRTVIGREQALSLTPSIDL